MRIKEAILGLVLVAALQLMVVPTASAAESFVLTDVEMIGLERISEGTALNYLPIREGDTVTGEDIQSAIRALFRAGFFSDVKARRSGGTVYFVVQERPTIAEFEIDGNREIETEQLREILRSQGLATGRILDQSVIDAVRSELVRLYHSRGRYNVIVDFKLESLANNLVEVFLDIKEGDVSRIRDINIVGNSRFDEERLLETMELKPSHFWSWLSADDKYAREKLVGDLESIKSFYFDRGYADFQVTNVVVSLSSNKQDVYITINVQEGEIYTVSDSKIVGNLVVPLDELERLVLLKPGETFSQRMAEAGAEYMSRRVEAEGFAFAKVTPVPDVNREERTVTVVYQVDPGRRVAVRSIMFEGAPGTDDEVYRRQMRQFEGAWLSNARLERSKVRIERLAFVERVESETVPVEGNEGLVDIVYDIKERSAGEFQIGVGYAGSATGIMGNVSISHVNFLGTGENVKLNVQSTSFQKVFSISHGDPYATIDGITRSTSVFYSSRDSLARGFEEFKTESLGASLDYVYPLSEYSSIGWGLSVSDNKVTAQTASISLPLEEFLLDPAHGDLTITTLPNGIDLASLEYLEMAGNVRAGFDSRNRSIFASRGAQRNVALQVAAAPGDIRYYKLTASDREFFGLGAGFTLTTKFEVALVDTYGESNAVPPASRLLAGGFDTIRGFQESRLGPKDVSVIDETTGEITHFGTDQPIGGKFRTFLQTELLLPNFAADDPEAPPESTQFSLFVDAGNLYAEPSDFTTDDWRVSTGLAATFLTPIGALRFSIGFPIRYEDGDNIERVQFTIGSVF